MERVKQLRGFIIKKYSKKECENKGIYYDLGGRIYHVFKNGTYLEEDLLYKEAIDYCENEYKIENDEKKYFEYLNGLRNSGVVNMFGATPYLVEKYKELDTSSAQNVLTRWMRSFKRNKQGC